MNTIQYGSMSSEMPNHLQVKQQQQQEKEFSWQRKSGTATKGNKHNIKQVEAKKKRESNVKLGRICLNRGQESPGKHTVCLGDTS